MVFGPFIGIRKEQDDAWKRVNEMVEARNDLLTPLWRHIHLAAGMSLSTAQFWDVDYEKARSILAKAEAMEPAIHAAIVELNVLSAKISKPDITIHAPEKLK